MLALFLPEFPRALFPPASSSDFGPRAIVQYDTEPLSPSFKYSAHPAKIKADLAAAFGPATADPDAPQLEAIEEYIERPKQPPILSMFRSSNGEPPVLPDGRLAKMDLPSMQRRSLVNEGNTCHIAASLRLFSDEFCEYAIPHFLIMIFSSDVSCSAFIEYSKSLEGHVEWCEHLQDLHGVPLHVFGMDPLFHELAVRLTMAASIAQVYSNFTISYKYGFTVRPK